MGLAQRIFGLAAGGNIHKRDHGPSYHPVFDDGVGRVLDREGGAVLAPEVLGVDAAGQPAPEGVEDRAQPLWVVLAALRAISVGVVRQIVHVVPQHLGGCPAQLLSPGAVDESAAAVGVDAEDALARGFEQLRQLVLPHHLASAGQVVRRQISRKWSE